MLVLSPLSATKTENCLVNLATFSSSTSACDAANSRPASDSTASPVFWDNLERLSCASIVDLVRATKDPTAAVAPIAANAVDTVAAVDDNFERLPCALAKAAAVLSLAVISIRVIAVVIILSLQPDLEKSAINQLLTQCLLHLHKLQCHPVPPSRSFLSLDSKFLTPGFLLQEVLPWALLFPYLCFRTGTKSLLFFQFKFSF